MGGPQISCLPGRCPARSRRAPYGFTEIANKIVNTNSRQVVGAACRPPVQFYLAVNARCCIRVPAPCRAGACPRRAVLPCPQIPCLRRIPRRGQDTRPTNLRNLRMNIVNCKFPSGRRAGACPRRAVLPCPQISRLPGRCPARSRRAPYKSTEFANKNGKLQIPVRPPVQFYLAANARCCIRVPAPCRAGS